MNILTGNGQLILAAVISITLFPLSGIAAYNQPHLVGSKIYFPNLPPSQKASIESLGKIRTPSANKCGVASASVTASNPWTSFTYNGATYQLSAIETHTLPSTCKTINGMPVIYIPLTP
jgi:hypothetical protein